MTQVFHNLQQDGVAPAITDTSQPIQSTTSPTDRPTTTTLTDPSSSLYPVFLLFGDSITQLCTSTFQSSLQELYSRRLDVLNRGFGGYTSIMGLETLTHFLPPDYPAPSQSNGIPQIKMATIFFGANDACLPDLPQHVPLPQYLDALRRITTYPVFQRHSTKIFLVTPTPINEHQLPQPVQRTAASAARYAAATRQLAADLGVPCVDIWSAMMGIAGYDRANPDVLPGSLDQPASGALASMFIDGLHPSAAGYSNLFIVLMDVIRREAPECLPENIPMTFRQWRDVLGVPQP